MPTLSKPIDRVFSRISVNKVSLAGETVVTNSGAGDCFSVAADIVSGATEIQYGASEALSGAADVYSGDAVSGAADVDSGAGDTVSGAVNNQRRIRNPWANKQDGKTRFSEDLPSTTSTTITSTAEATLRKDLNNGETKVSRGSAKGVLYDSRDSPSGAMNNQGCIRQAWTTKLAEINEDWPLLRPSSTITTTSGQGTLVKELNCGKNDGKTGTSRGSSKSGVMDAATSGAADVTVSGAVNNQGCIRQSWTTKSAEFNEDWPLLKPSPATSMTPTTTPTVAATTCREGSSDRKMKEKDGASNVLSGAMNNQGCIRQAWTTKSAEFNEEWPCLKTSLSPATTRAEKVAATTCREGSSDGKTKAKDGASDVLSGAVNNRKHNAWSTKRDECSEDFPTLKPSSAITATTTSTTTAEHATLRKELKDGKTKATRSWPNRVLSGDADVISCAVNNQLCILQDPLTKPDGFSEDFPTLKASPVTTITGTSPTLTIAATTIAATTTTITGQAKLGKKLNDAETKASIGSAKGESVDVCESLDNQKNPDKTSKSSQKKNTEWPFQKRSYASSLRRQSRTNAIPTTTTTTTTTTKIITTTVDQLNILTSKSSKLNGIRDNVSKGKLIEQRKVLKPNSDKPSEKNSLNKDVKVSAEIADKTKIDVKSANEIGKGRIQLYSDILKNISIKSSKIINLDTHKPIISRVLYSDKVKNSKKITALKPKKT